MKILVIIPTYNEKENIEKLTGQIFGLNADMDVLVIDDNSPDGTGRIIDDLKSRNPKLNVIHREKKLGLGTAYITGFAWALARDYEYIFSMDADFSHNPDYLPGFVDKLSEYNLIIGSRYVKGGGVLNWPLHRKLISKIGNFYAKTILGYPVNDSTSGFMGFRRQVLEKMELDKIKSEGYGFLIEMKYRAHKYGFKTFEYPIVFADRTLGKSKISKNIIFEAFFLVWKLKAI